MQSPSIHELVQQISEEIRAGMASGEIASERLVQLADELKAAGQEAESEIDSAIEAVVELLTNLSNSSEEDATSIVSELQLCLGEFGEQANDTPAIDDPILLGFLDDRADAVEELEDLALALEQTGDQENRAAILRLVHSVKGDAGVLGLNDLSELCHELESEIEGTDDETATRLTLEATAKMQKRFAQLASGEQPSKCEEQAFVLIDDEAVSREREKEPSFVVTVPEPDVMEDADGELTAEFVVEAQEHLDSVDSNLLLLESEDEAERTEAVNGVFRAFHTIKGLSGFLNLNILMGLAHEAEAMLHRVRSEEVELNEHVVNAAFLVSDGLRALVNAVEASLANNEPILPPSNYVELVTALHDACSEKPKGESTAVSSGPTEAPRNSASGRSASDEAQSSRADRPQQAVAPSSAVRSTIKVDASRLDDLIDMIGELVIAEAMVNQCDELSFDGMVRLPNLLGQLDKTTRELQEMSMSLRMVPIRSTFRRMARLARDVSHKVGKRIEFVTKGDDTELDKTVVDVIGDPLVHMVRNSIDHGIERTAEDREKAGKPPVGRIELRAFHEGGSIHVEIEDDGKGLDREVILAKARENGIVGVDGDALTDSEVFGLIFAPGFSTAEAVTEVSGRGVGLDVVRRNIEGLRGRVEISSTPGQGSIFSIRLPLTLAIIDGMIVRIGSRRYIVPTLSIIRMFQPRPEGVTTILGKGKMLRVGDDLVSLYHLSELLGLGDSVEDFSEMSAIVVEGPGGSFAFLVDELLGKQQIVIKPLGDALAGIKGFAGGAIMPDGTVGLILDIAGLVSIGTSLAGAV